MSNDPVQKRKEEKPRKLFSINATVFDDGVISGNCVEIRDLGRMKNQKCIVPSYDDFIACVRSLVPSSVPMIEKLAQQIFDDMEVTETDHCEKIGRVVVDIYADGFVDQDFGELVQGDRGAPKTWRLDARDFFGVLEARVGQLTTPFQPLLDSGPYTKPVQPITVIDEGDDVEEDLQDDERDDSLEQNLEDEN